jgi:hypothetical protein
MLALVSVSIGVSISSAIAAALKNNVKTGMQI